MPISKLVTTPVLGLIIFGSMFLLSLQRQSHVEQSGTRILHFGSLPFSLCICAGIALVIGCWIAGIGPAIVVAPNPRALFEESRLGVTRSDVRDQIREMENRVPDTLRDMESRLPQYSADLEREMMKNAYKYGSYQSDVRTQVREIESQARQQIRGMDADVRRQIRNLEEPTWEELRRIERGR